MNINELERKVHQKKFEPTIEDYDTLIDHFRKLSESEDKETMLAAVRKYAHYVAEASSRLDIEDPKKLKQYIDILSDAMAKLPYGGQYNADLNKMTGKWLELTGNDKASVIKEEKGYAGIESGVFAFGDPELAKELPELKEFTDKELDSHVKTGKIAYLSAEGDGKYGVTVRLLDASEPVLKPNEYKNVIYSTEVLPMKNQSGVFRAGDMGLYDEHWDVTDMEVEPGDYKAMIFAVDVPDTYFGFIVVLCRA